MRMIIDSNKLSSGGSHRVPVLFRDEVDDRSFCLLPSSFCRYPNPYIRNPSFSLRKTRAIQQSSGGTTA